MAGVDPVIERRPVGCGEERRRVRWGLRTPSVPPEKIDMELGGIRGVHTAVPRVREKSLTQPLP